MNFRLSATDGCIVPLEARWPSEALQARISKAPRATAGPSPFPLPGGGGSTPKHRRNDPASSRRAAVAAPPRAGTCKARLLDAIAQAPNGLTAHAASEASGVTYVTASTRLTEMVRDGLLRRTGFTRETANGGEADILVIARDACEAVA